MSESTPMNASYVEEYERENVWSSLQTVYGAVLTAVRREVLSQCLARGWSEDVSRIADVTIYRFLKAWSWDTNLAINKLMATLEWRERVSWHAQCIIASRIRSQLELVHGRTISRYFPHHISYGYDRANNLLSILSPGRIRPGDLQYHLPLSQFSAYQLQHLMHVGKRLEQESLRRGFVVRATRIIDLQGISLAHVRDSAMRAYLKAVLGDAQEHLCEHLSRVVVVNAPTLVGALWKVVQPLLYERTRSKVKICGGPSEYQPVLDELVAPEQLPLHLGGSNLRRCQFELDQYLKLFTLIEVSSRQCVKHLIHIESPALPDAPRFDIDETNLLPDDLFHFDGEQINDVQLMIDGDTNLADQQLKIEGDGETIMRWELHVDEGYDIGLSVGIIDTRLNPPLKVGNGDVTVTGAIRVAAPATVVFELDNSYSTFTAKRIRIKTWCSCS